MSRATFRMRIEPEALPPQRAVLVDRIEWIKEQTLQLAIDLGSAGSTRDAEQIKRQIAALRGLDPQSDAQWLALNENG